MFSLTTHAPASEFGDSLDPCVCRTKLAGAYLYLWELLLDGRELLLGFDTAGFFSPALACLRIFQKIRGIGSCLPPSGWMPFFRVWLAVLEYDGFGEFTMHL